MYYFFAGGILYFVSLKKSSLIGGEFSFAWGYHVDGHYAYVKQDSIALREMVAINYTADLALVRQSTCLDFRVWYCLEYRCFKKYRCLKYRCLKYRCSEYH